MVQTDETHQNLAEHRSFLLVKQAEQTDQEELRAEDKFMKKQKPEYEKDDEILREEGMTDGTKTILGIDFRPVTALSVSWMHRNEIFSDKKDLIWKSAAFAFLHSAPFPVIRSVVNDKDLFMDAVDMWIEKNIAHHAALDAVGVAMNDGFKAYAASASHPVGNGQKGSASGN